MKKQPGVGSMVWKIELLLQGNILPLQVYEVVKENEAIFLRLTPYPASPLFPLIHIKDIITKEKIARRIAIVAIREKQKELKKQIGEIRRRPMARAA